MPSTVSGLFKKTGMKLQGRVKWGENPNSRKPGIYLVSMSPSENDNRITLKQAPISLERISYWLNRVQTVQLDGLICTSSREISERLSEFWLADESIIYIGQTTKRLDRRVNDYYITNLGDRRPHAGGYWIKTLSNLNEMYVYFAECIDPHGSEDNLIESFISGVSEVTRSSLYDKDKPFPFANLEYPKGNRKIHGISKTKLK